MLGALLSSSNIKQTFETTCIWNRQFWAIIGWNKSGYPWDSPKSDIAMTSPDTPFVGKSLESEWLPSGLKFSSNMSFGKTFGEVNTMMEDPALPKTSPMLQLNGGPTTAAKCVHLQCHVPVH